MRKNHFISVWTALVVLSLTACNVKQLDLPADTVSGENTGTVLVQVKAPESPELLTKVDGGSTQLENEKKVNSLQVFIFKKTGDDPADNLLETDKYVTGANTVSLNTLTGDKVIWALVNAPRLNNITNEKKLQDEACWLKYNTPDNLVMVGHGDANVKQFNASGDAALGSKTPVEIEVKHLCARISLHSVAADFRGTSLEGAKLTLLEAYLLNVPNICTFGGRAMTISELSNPLYWYNFRALGTSSNEVYLNDTHKVLKESGLSLSINTSDATVGTSVNKFFYMCPNVSTEKSDDEAYSARLTRLILHTYIEKDSRKFDSYYSFNIPVYGSGLTIESNHVYAISKITITNAGSTVPPPFPDMEYGKVNASIEVGEWGTPKTLSYEF